MMGLIAGELRPDAGELRVEPEGTRVTVCSQTIEEIEPAIQAFAADDGREARRLRDRLALDPVMFARAGLAAHHARRRRRARRRSRGAARRARVLSLVAALGVDPDRLLVSRRPSPGESRKVMIALGLGRHVWALVLDEPTNRLDLPSIERLEVARAGYPGALVLVTHDAAFAKRCTSMVWRVEGQEARVAS